MSTYGISEELRIRRAEPARKARMSPRFGFTAGTSSSAPTPRTAAPLRNAPYTRDELEYLMAVDRFKHSTGLFFPTYSDLFRIAKSLGYVRLPTAPSRPTSRDDADASNGMRD